MESITATLLSNAAGAALLAAAVVVAARRIDRPSIVHALWVVVLLKLLVPPLFEVAALPGWARWGASATASVVAGGEVVTAPTSAGVAVVSRTFDWGAAVTGAGVAAQWIWAVGALAMLALFTIRVARFQRLLRRTPAAPPRLMVTVERLAQAIGLSSPPRVRIIRGHLPPMVWSGPAGCELLLPQALIERLERRELEALIAHELGHIRRRDHWVRYLETAATIVFWWNPLVHWARRRLRVAEESSCDALVLRTLPAHARAYAHGLLKTLELVAGGTARVPAFATGALETRRIKERLQMIVHHRPPATTTHSQRWLLVTLAAALLLVLPTWAEKDPPPAAADDPRAEELADVLRRKAELEHALQEVISRQHVLERQLELDRSQLELLIMREDSARLEAEGRAIAPAEARAKIERIDATGDLALQLDQLMLEVEEARARGDASRADSMRQKALQLRHELAAVRERVGAAEADAARALAYELQKLEEQGRHDEARELREELLRLEREIDRREPAGDPAEPGDREPGTVR